MPPPVDGTDSAAGLLDELCRLAVEQKEKCNEKRWKFNFNGQQVILYDVAQKIFYWLQKFKEVGDIAVNFDPVHAALPWATFRFLLQVISNTIIERSVCQVIY
jgi:ankyrin repeat domain-containing protein 50